MFASRRSLAAPKWFHDGGARNDFRQRRDRRGGAQGEAECGERSRHVVSNRDRDTGRGNDGQN